MGYFGICNIFAKKILNMNKIIGLGNALVDVLVTLDDDRLLEEMNLPRGSMQLIDERRYQQISEIFSTMDPHVATGGSAANTILGLACLGMPTGFVGKVGNDRFGKFFRDNLSRNFIDDRLLQSDTLPSGVASTFISPDGERTFGTFLGAAADLKAEELEPCLFSGGDYLYLEGYLVQNHALVLRAVELAKQAGMKICIDMASYNVVAGDLEFFTMLVGRYADIVFANEEEARAFTGADQPEEALAQLAGKCDIAVVKVGAKGALVARGSETAVVSPLPVDRVVDATGAGDYFAAGFLCGLTRGCPLEQCGRLGTLLAGNVIQVVGTTIPAERWHEIKLNINRIQAE